MTERDNDARPGDRAKRAAARAACDHVRDGMRLGLGTGSTAAFLIARLGERIRDEGLRVTGVATSTRTEALARQAGIPIATLDRLDRPDWLDLTVDGADEVDPALRLIKGGGGALLREKIVAAASDRMIVIADAGKRVPALGAFPLPIEVVAFGLAATRRLAAEAAGIPCDAVTLRIDGDTPFATDGGNRILDLAMGRIGAPADPADPADLAARLCAVPGVVDTGLFVGLCDLAIFGHPDGTTTELTTTGDVA